MMFATHQPIFLPWPGLFCKLVHAGTLVILDDVQFPRGRSWMARNRVKSDAGELWLRSLHSGWYPLQEMGSGNRPSGRGHFLIFRFLPDGRPDNSFHKDGVRTIGFSMPWRYTHSGALTPNDRLVVAGKAAYAPGPTYIALARVLLN